MSSVDVGVLIAVRQSQFEFFSPEPAGVKRLKRRGIDAAIEPSPFGQQRAGVELRQQLRLALPFVKRQGKRSANALAPSGANGRCQFAGCVSVL